MSEQRELGKITAILADLGLEVTYAYDDLVFIQHSAFLLQFTEDPNTLKIFTNSECHAGEAEIIVANMAGNFAEKGFTLTPSGNYTLSENENETLNLKFS